MSPVKETNFFALEGETLYFRGLIRTTSTGAQSLKIEDYLNLFQGVDNQVAIGEASPVTSITQRLPSVFRTTYLMQTNRHSAQPADRAYSSFCIWFVMVVNHLEILAKALREEEVRIRSNWEHIWHYKQVDFTMFN